LVDTLVSTVKIITVMCDETAGETASGDHQQVFIDFEKLRV
jgi:hypothetical protein